MADDPTITRIRIVRHQISAHYHHNVKELVAHYGELEQRYQHRMVKQSPPTRENQATEEQTPSDIIHETPSSLAGNF